MSTKHAVFQINGEEYGMDIRDVHTVEKDISIKRTANMPKNVKGKFDLRGDEIPVYSLRRKFGIQDKEQDKDTRFLITDVNGMDIAFEVDHVKGILDIESSDIFDLPQIIKCNNTSYIKSIANKGDGLILLLDSNFLLDTEEMKVLQAKNKK